MPAVFDSDLEMQIINTKCGVWLWEIVGYSTVVDGISTRILKKWSISRKHM